MNVPRLDLLAQHQALSEEIQTALARVFAHGQFILGPEVKELEEALSAHVGAAYAVGCASGSDALLLSLLAEGIGPDDAVITTAYSFFATAGAIARAGATPVFVDIAPEGFHLDCARLAEYLRGCVPEKGSGALFDPARKKRVRAVIPVHLFGQAMRMEPLLALAREYSLVVIEDTAQALGARDGERKVGALGEYGCVSFFPSKNLGGVGDGGMIFTSDPERNARLRALRTHGVFEGKHRLIGLNSRLDTLQAAVLLAKLPHLERFTRRREALALAYREALRDLPLILPEACPGAVWNQFVIRHPAREELRAFLKERGVETAVYYPVPLPYQPCFSALGAKEGDFPCAEAAARESLALPLFPEMTCSQQEQVISGIREFFLRGAQGAF